MEDNKAKEYVQKAASLIVQEFDDYALSAIKISEKYKIQGADLVSDRLIAHRGIGEEIKRKVRERAEIISKMISGLAYLVEQENIKSAEEAFSRLKQSSLNAANTERLDRLERANEKVRLSFSTLSTLIDIFTSAMKETYYEEAQTSASRADDKSGKNINSHLKRAIVVRELASFMYNYLSEFSISGIDDLKSVHRDMMGRVKELKDDLARKDAEFRAAGRHEYLQRNEARRGALQVVERKWDDFLIGIKKTEGAAEKGKELLLDLKFIRDDAQSEIETIEIIAASQVTYDYAQSISDLSEKLKKLAPPPMDAELAAQLLGFTSGLQA